MKNCSLKGKTVFITGASSGIGKACAETFASHGSNVVITARRLGRLEDLARKLEQEGVKVFPFELDVQKNEQVEAVFEKLKKEKIEIDVLINNAGLAVTSDKMQDGKVGNWDRMIDTNIKGLLYVTRAVLSSMTQRNQGHIINIGSVAGRFCYTGGNIYCATKFAVKSICQSLRIDLFGTAIRVSEIAPGAVETEFSEVRWNDKEKAKQLYQGFDPLTAEDIADAVFYCATRPMHVNVSEIVIYPQAQASISEIYRPGKEPAKNLFNSKN